MDLAAGAIAACIFLNAPLYIAKDAGLYSKRELDVSLVSTRGSEKTWAAVTSGNASFGVADPTFVAISDARGQPGTVIPSVVNGVPFWGILYLYMFQRCSCSSSLPVQFATSLPRFALRVVSCSYCLTIRRPWILLNSTV